MENKAGFTKQKKIVLIGASSAALVLMVVVYLLASSSSQPKPSDNPTPVDPALTSQIINTTELAQPAGPDYSALIDRGFSNRHIDVLQYALFQFTQPKNISVKDTSVPRESVSHFSSDPDNGIFFQTYNFTVKFDEVNSFKAKAEVSGLSGLRLYLYDSNTNALLYDSKQLDAKAIN